VNCLKCNNILEDNSSYCTSCGNEISSQNKSVSVYKKSLIFLCLFILGLGIIVTKIFISPSSSEKNLTSSTTIEYYKVPINDLVLNISSNNGSEKLMKISFTIRSTEPTIAKIIERNKSEIIDIIIQQISRMTSEILLTIGGKESLKKEILSEINLVVNDISKTNENVKKNNIKNLYFTAFVIK